MKEKLQQKTLSGENITVKKKTHKTKKGTDSEYQSYVYIRNELKDKGWNIANPNRDPSGQVYTQNECLQNPEITSKWVDFTQSTRLNCPRISIG